jgi:hypothetical protein
MNKEYDNNNKGSLWLADKKTVKGEPYFNGNITIENKEYSITMFKNDSDNPKAPAFKIKVNTPKKDGQAIEGNGHYQESNTTLRGKQESEDEPYITFGNTVELSDQDINFDSEIAF